ncbi:MAG: response regulator [Vulcanimicrobiota bacterium]
MLLLEDDANLRQVLSDVLQDEGYQVTTAGDGEAAVALASQQTFDLVITDIRMDGVDGLQALERARGYQPELSSLVVSGYTSEAETLRALQLNVGGFLKKPFALSDFLQRTRELLQQRRQHLEQRRALQRLRSSFWWSLLAAAPNTQEVAQMAVHLARQANLSGEECQIVRLASILYAQSEGPLSHLPPGAGDDQLGLGPILKLVQEARHGGPPGLGAQIVQLANWLGRAEGPPDQAWDSRLVPFLQDRPDPNLLAASLAEHEAELGLIDQRLRHKMLLGLAASLEEAGNASAAEQAYRRLHQEPDLSAELHSEALIGSARVLLQQGQSSWYERLKEAELSTRKLGPMAGALRRWPIGVMLFRSAHPSAAAYLAQLEGEMGELGLEVLAAKARVARARFSIESESQLRAAMELLLRPQQLGQVSQDSDWLVGALLSLAPTSQLPPGPSWSRLLCEFPRAAQQWLQVAEPPALARLMENLELAPELAPTSLLEALKVHPDGQISRRASELAGFNQGNTFVRFRSFGEFAVFVNGERVADKAYKTQKFKWVLAYLVARRGHRVPEDLLVEAFWPESPGSGKANVYSATTNLRRCLRAAGAEQEEFVLREHEQLYFDPRLSCWHDLEEYENARAQGDLASLRQALDLVTGPYLQGCYLDWAERRRSQLDEELTELYLKVARDYLDEKPQATLDYSQKVLDLNPLQQEAHLLRMQAFLKSKQPDRAIKQYEVCQRDLQRELGIEPLTALVESYHRARLALP